MQSKGQAVFWALSPALLAVKSPDRDFAHVQLIDDQRVKGNCRGQAVKAIFVGQKS
jgi:hypothetical protein